MNLKINFVLLPCLVLAVLLSACASNSSIRQAIKDNPDIIFDAIKDNPEKFMSAANRAYESSKLAQETEAQKQALAAKETDFKNPLKPTVTDNRAVRGNLTAPVLIVSYSDFQCPYCRRGKEILDSLQEKYGDKVAIVQKHLPLDFHPQAMISAMYFEAISLQDKKAAYRFSDEVYQNQGELGKDGVKYLDRIVAKLKINPAKLKKDLKSKVVENRIREDMAEASKFDLNGTPAFLVGGIRISGAQPVEVFETIIDRRLSEKKEEPPSKG